MERSATMDIREEGKELREAAEQTLNVILDLSLDGRIKWASPTWEEVMGIPFEAVLDKSMSEIAYGDTQAFADAVQLMRKNDSRSKIVQFSVRAGSKSVLRSPVETIKSSMPDTGEPTNEEEIAIINMEAQGIMVYDHATGQESHVSAPPYNMGSSRVELLTTTRPCG